VSSLPNTAGWTIQILADFIQKQRDHDAEQVRLRFDSSQEAVGLALKANDQRLSAMGASRELMANQLLLTMSTKEVDAQLNPIRDALAAQMRPNWPLWLGVFSVATGMIAAVWLLIGMQISVAISPQVVAVAQIASGQTAIANRLTITEAGIQSDDVNIRGLLEAASTSRQDRSGLNDRIGMMEKTINEGRASRMAVEARFSAELVEIETQFCASDSVRNIMHSNDMAVVSLLWSVTHDGAVYPTDNAYYPIVCNRNASH
jgi:hypothetical protein